MEDKIEIELISPAKQAIKKPKRGWLPPYSLMVLAGLTQKGINVKITDEAVDTLNLDSNADLYGITISWSARAPRAYWIADELRKRGKAVVVGGAHVTANPDEALKHSDAVVIGEAEGVWQSLLEDFTSGNLRQVYENAHPSLSGIRPRRDLIDAKKYVAVNVVQTTRGCPHDCDFCAVPIVYGRGYRHRPLEEVLEEIDSLKGSTVFFLDDNITGDPAYAEKLFEALIPRGKIWFGQSDLLIAKRPKLLKLAKKSGCKGLFIGFETIAREGLEGVNKQWNKAGEYSSVIKTLHRHGIGIIGAFIFGLDGDSPATIDRTVDFVRKNGIEVVQYSILTPLPGTRLFERLAEQGRINPSTLDYSLLDGIHAVYEPKNMTREELQSGFYKAYEKTYSFFSSLARSRRYPQAYVPINLGFWNHYRGISKVHKSVCSFMQSQSFQNFIDSVKGKAQLVYCLSQRGKCLYYEAREKLGNVVASLKIPAGKSKKKLDYINEEISREISAITGLPVLYEN